MGASTITRTSGLGAGGAQQHPAVAAQGRLLVGDGGEEDLVVGARLVDAGHVDEHLRQPGHHRGEVAQAATGGGHAGQEVQPGEDAVAGGGVLAHDHVARLLAAQREAGGPHRLEDVAVADLGLVHVQARGRHGLDEAEVAHHGGDHGVAGQGAALGHRQRQHGEDLVAVDDLPRVVDGQAAVGVAVEGDAGVGAVRDDGGLQRPEVGRAAPVVDVEAVGVGTDRDDLGPRAAQRHRAGHVGGAVRAVDDDLEAAQRGVEGGQQVRDVLLDRRRVRRDPPDRAADGALPLLAEDRLDGVLEGVVELVAAVGEELDAVVGHRVVRGRDDHAEVGAEGVGEVGDGRGGQHPQAQHVDPGRGEARHDGVLEELPRDPGVAPDDGQRPRPGGVALAAVDDHPCRGDRQVQGQLRRQCGVRQAPDTVGAEDVGQEISAC